MPTKGILNPQLIEICLYNQKNQFLNGHGIAASKFFFFMQLDYPNLLDAWYGYMGNIISSRDFRNIAAAFKNHQIPPQDTRLGGYIGIHGLGDVSAEALKIHRNNNWTDGCIALKNEEINELRRYVSIGTPIIIRP